MISSIQLSPRMGKVLASPISDETYIQNLYRTPASQRKKKDEKFNLKIDKDFEQTFLHKRYMNS